MTPGSAAVRILVVEDDPGAGSVLRDVLELQGWQATLVTTAAAARTALDADVPDLALLDVTLPDGDGHALCRDWRGAGISLPVLFVTGREGPAATIDALEAGGDGLLSKPFVADVLCARIRALLRRRTAGTAARLSYGDLELDVPARKVRRGDRDVRLAEREFQLLAYLVRHAERVVSRGEITVRVWHMESPPSSNVVDVCVWSLRRKIDQGFADPLLHTVKGAGYRLGHIRAADDL